MKEEGASDDPPGWRPPLAWREWGSPVTSGSGTDAGGRAMAAERAVGTWRGLQRRLYVAHRRLFGSRRWLSRDYEALWPFSGAWSACGSLASLDGQPVSSEELASFRQGLTAYHRDHDAVLAGRESLGFESMVVPPLGSGGDVYFDDNAWVALALLQEHRVTGEAQCVTLARRIIDFVLTGWSTEQSWSHPGGIRWKVPVSNRSRNTCSNGPTAEAAVELHRLTGDPALLDWGRRIYEWTRDTLRRPDGLYADRIDPAGSVTDDIWSYNQGTMLGAGVLLSAALDDEAHLDEASETAAASLRRFNPQVLAGQLPAFNAVFFRNLLVLDRVRPDGEYWSLARAYGDFMWAQLRDGASGLFKGTGAPLNHNAPMAEVYALLAGAEPHP